MDIKEERNGNYEKDLEGNESRTKDAFSSKVHKVEIKWSRERQDKLHGRYGKRSKRTQIRYQKSAWELEKEAFKTYDIRALWQQSQITNSHIGLEQLIKSAPNDSVSSICPLFKILQESLPLLFKQQTHRNQQVEALKDMTRLFTLVTEQEKKYEDRLSSYSHLYHCHLMIQQFF